MLYKEKLAQCLKTEHNAINKMYLNELLISWRKVETAIEEAKEFPISAMISAISNFTRVLTVAKFRYNSTQKCGFKENHDVFQGYYLQDIAEVILEVAGIKEDKQGLFIKNRPINTGFRLEQNSFKKTINKPKFEFFSTGKYLTVGLEFDFNYKLIAKTHYNRVRICVPLIVFFIEKVFSERSFEEINQLKKDTIAINPNALLICLTESVDKHFIHLYNEIEENLYVLRANYKDDEFKDMQPQVGLSLYNKLQNFANKEFYSFDKIVPFGHVDLVPKTYVADTETHETEKDVLVDQETC